ncbi:hypothetical protein B0H63DRAFT_504525 [Podospora didyma]|uniref:Nucleoside phosphorylase domain-containing protein n=1 Tax=Podospora didyma TaxID=330526 RepID=A0AAE0N1Q9_9PEZI|nr:hypothetical protein B0H63DRAFT_504525 [Podospora didyma]
MSPLGKYTVGWICAVSTEYVAAQVLLDEKHKAPESVSDNDSNVYTLGKIGNHNVVVIAALPGGEYGISSATGVAKDMLHTFPNIRVGLMVGIGGGAPSAKHDIRLGDVVVSSPYNGNGGVVQYDFGAMIQNQGMNFYPRLRNKYSRPSPSSDRFCTNVCSGDPSNIVLRLERTKEQDDPAIHYGLIASANQLMKNALIRDKLAAEKDVLCFEMEAAGLMNHFPCLVIRGVCDYSDTHINKEWQGYAAMTAAAYAKALLCRIPPNKVEVEKTIEEIINAVTAVISKTGEALQAVQSKLEGKQDLEILEWLTPMSFGPQQSDFFSRRQPGTGQRLLDSKEFTIWLGTSKETLFCPGIPGAGKTILASTVVDRLITDFGHCDSIGIAYLYCNFHRKAEQTTEGLLASLLKQLAQQRPSLPDPVKSLYEKHWKRQTRPSIEEISTSLQSVASAYSRVFVVVDALDECQVSEGCCSRLLSEIFALQASKCEANIFATARPVLEITTKFDESPSVEIRADDEDVKRYIEEHIKHKMPRLQELIQARPELENNIKASITNSTKGMFLIAQIYLHSLDEKTTPGEVLAALAEFQKEGAGSEEGQRSEQLRSAYHRTMERIMGQGPEPLKLATQAVTWITCAERVLTAVELQHAIAVNDGDTKLKGDNIPIINRIVSVCAGLVIVDTNSGTIRLVHYTTQDYLDQTKTSRFQDAKSDIQETCVTYLSFNAFASGMCRTDNEFEQRLRSNPLYAYAALNWGHHTRKSPSLCPVTKDFLSCQGKVESASQALIISERSYSLHLAAILGIDKAVDFLISDFKSLNLRDSYGQTPLSLAARNGREAVVELLAVVKLLVTSQAEVDAKDNNGQTPLSLAAVRGREAVGFRVLEHSRVIELTTGDWMAKDLEMTTAENDPDRGA